MDAICRAIVTALLPIRPLFVHQAGTAASANVTERGEKPIAELWIWMLVVAANLLACCFMNILIENAETLEYFTSTGLWTKNAEKGKCFGATTAALAAAKAEPIGKFNIVSYITQTKQFINLDHGRGKGAEAVTG